MILNAMVGHLKSCLPSSFVVGVVLMLGVLTTITCSTKMAAESTIPLSGLMAKMLT